MSYEGDLTVPKAPKLGTRDLDDEDDIYYPPNPNGYQEDFPMASPTGCHTPQSNPATPTPRNASTLFDGTEGLNNSAFSTPVKRSNQGANMAHRSLGKKIPKLDGSISSSSEGKGKERAIYTMAEASMSDDAVLDRMGLSLAGFDRGLKVGESDDSKRRDESVYQK
ncbi:hypothetical protein Moror_4066 [Moniliophthora roreri MCA 2997]|uniref:Uncharacterized protein n=2 Tax=Moniliophthora roreri TaxID=221103 RepID=V2YGG6_MONRO|nr:hypothetical protein Moror_4066 [Moniliophthora roreri MCA 2997]KAI3609258.1 hypothetical protein WG66_010546 [Moniliophthora roreri]